MRRGEIWWVDLPPPTGSGPGFRHPAVIIQNNRFNESRLATLIVAMITSNLRLSEAPGNVTLTPKESGLPRASVVNITQLFTVDRHQLHRQVGRLPDGKRAELDCGLRFALAL